MSEVDFVRHSCSTDHMSCFAIMHYLIQFLCYTRTHLTCYNDLRVLSLFDILNVEGKIFLSFCMWISASYFKKTISNQMHSFLNILAWKKRVVNVFQFY